MGGFEIGYTTAGDCVVNPAAMHTQQGEARRGEAVQWILLLVDVTPPFWP